MFKFGTKIMIIDAGYGAGDCNGYIGEVVAEIKEDLDGHGLSENEPHVKIILDRGVYQKMQREYWRVNTPENGLKYKVCSGRKKQNFGWIMKEVFRRLQQI